MRVLLLAMILGVIAAGLVVAYLSRSDSGGGGEATGPTMSVVVAAEDIAPGQEITDSMVSLKSLPQSAVLDNAATAKTQVIGQTLRYPVSKGEQLSNLRLVEPPAVQALSFQIPKGLRGFTVPVSVTSSPAALLAPGDFVDVLMSVDLDSIVLVDPPPPPEGVEAPPAVEPPPPPPLGLEDSAEEPKASVTLLQNVQVLTVEREYVDNGVPYEPSVRGEMPDEESVTYVTLAVSPEQAQILWLALQDGALTLALRAFGDGDIRHLSPVMQPLPVIR